jgi:hypothetical protein
MTRVLLSALLLLLFLLLPLRLEAAMCAQGGEQTYNRCTAVCALDGSLPADVLRRAGLEGAA